MTAPYFSVREIRMFERKVTLRLPFRFGIVTLKEAPQVFVRCRIRLADGREGWGLSAELMVPKWFDKNPDLTNDQNFAQLRRALELYAGAIQANAENTAFGHYATLYNEQLKAGSEDGLNPLAASFGPALIDRAVFDAVCRLHKVSFASAIQNNLAAFDPKKILDEFSEFDMPKFTATLKPADHIHARHTIGMIDPLTSDDQSPGDRIEDGLPETLVEVIDTYAHSYFKIKVGGDLAADIERLKKIAAVLDNKIPVYKATLDGNEQYENVDHVIELLSAIKSEPSLKRLSDSILFVEQPIHRKNALECNVSALKEYLPIIIDESDADLTAFPTARKLGYSGVSSKNCKGFYKSLINLARCEIYTNLDNRPYFMSAEDLTCQAGVSVQQDLALVSLLGLAHVERNGHHYVNGMAGAHEAEQNQFIEAHPDLYRRINGRVCTHIENGMFSIRSLQCIGFGTNAEPDWQAMSEMETAR
jgi:hypothetical protein